MRDNLEKWHYVAGILVGLVALVALYDRFVPDKKMPEISNCTVYSEDRESCNRCDFELSERAAQSRFIERTCFNMPSSEEVAVQFVGSYFVTNRPAGSDCGLDNTLMRVDGTTTDRAHHTNVLSCKVETTRATGFFDPKKPGEATGAFQVAQCQWGGNPNMNCDLEGTLSIFTRRGQK